MKKIIVITSLIYLLFASLVTNNVYSQYTIDAYARGWYSSDGIHHDWNGNTLTGAVPDYYWSGQPFYAEFHSFFVFDLSSISAEVTSATLNLELTTYNSNDSFEVFTIYDVSTPINDLLENRPPCGSYPPPSGCMPPPSNSNYGQIIFDDLGSGASYGFTQVSAGDTGSIISISLQTNAISDINSTSLFAVGIALNDIGTMSNDEYIRFSNTEEQRVHQLELTVVPEPISSILFVTGGSLLAGRRFMKRKKKA